MEKGKKPKSNKCSSIQIRLKPFNKAIVKKKAELAGLSFSEYVRRRILNKQIMVKKQASMIEVEMILIELKTHLNKLEQLIKVSDDELLALDNVKLINKIEKQLKQQS